MSKLLMKKFLRIMSGTWHQISAFQDQNWRLWVTVSRNLVSCLSQLLSMGCQNVLWSSSLESCQVYMHQISAVHDQNWRLWVTVSRNLISCLSQLLSMECQNFLWKSFLESCQVHGTKFQLSRTKIDDCELQWVGTLSAVWVSCWAWNVKTSKERVS